MATVKDLDPANGGQSSERALDLVLALGNRLVPQELGADHGRVALEPAGVVRLHPQADVDLALFGAQLLLDSRVHPIGGLDLADTHAQLPVTLSRSWERSPCCVPFTTQVWSSST